MHALPRIQREIGEKAWEASQKEKAKARISYNYSENNDEEDGVVKVDGKKEEPESKDKASSKVFYLVKMKPNLGGSNDWGSRTDKRREGGVGGVVEEDESRKSLCDELRLVYVFTI